MKTPVFIFLTAAIFLAPELVGGASLYKASLLKSLQNGKANIIVSFRDTDPQKILNAHTSRTFQTRSDKSNSIYQALKAHSDLTQAPVLQTLNKLRSVNVNLEVTQLWITNQLIIKNLDLQSFTALLETDVISNIEEEEFVPLPEAPMTRALPGDENLIKPPWGMTRINVQDVWTTYKKRGSGVIVATIDSGVRGTHEALREGFRSFHGWFDPVNRTRIPTDTNGHGTHTMGTILGRNNTIGVAPEAQWIACRACPDGLCSTVNLLQCGQWVACPGDASGWDPRCDLAPDIVSNSWGYGRNQFFHHIVDVWIAMGIVPIVSSGNYGNMCGTIISPADHPDVIAVASVDNDDRASYFSGRGPVTKTGLLKPDIAAPGLYVYSSSWESDSSYIMMDGTSMAAPHVSGVVALMLNYQPNLKLAQIRTFLLDGAQPHVPENQKCGGIQDSSYPNNQVGRGILDARETFRLLHRPLP